MGGGGGLWCSTAFEGLGENDTHLLRRQWRGWWGKGPIPAAPPSLLSFLRRLHFCAAREQAAHPHPLIFLLELGVTSLSCPGRGSEDP